MRAVFLRNVSHRKKFNELNSILRKLNILEIFFCFFDTSWDFAKKEIVS